MRPVSRASINASTGKIKRGANLARLEQISDAVGFPGFKPVTLIVEHRGVEDFFQLFDLFVGENVLFRLTAWAFVAIGYFWV